VEHLWSTFNPVASALLANNRQKLEKPPGANTLAYLAWL